MTEKKRFVGRYSLFAFAISIALIISSYFPSAIINLLMITNCILPWITLSLAIKYNNEIPFGTAAKNEFFNDLSSVWILNSITILLATIGMTLGDTYNLWLITGAISLIFFLTVFFFVNTQKSLLKRFSIALMIAIFGVSYGYGLSVYVNVRFDKTEVSYEASKIINKDINVGKSIRYYIYVNLKGHKDSVKFYVSSDKYKQLTVGDDILVEHHQGYLRIPWFRLKYL